MNPFIKALDEKIEKMKYLNDHVEEMVVEVLVDNQHIIIDMNAEEQLFIRGVDSDNVPLMKEHPYSPYTVQIKKQKGQPTNRVTTRDSGDFHDSFKLKKSKTSVLITATDEKTFDLTMKYGDAIFGLIPENFNEVQIHYVKPEILKRLREI
jgi:hypothetical protein